MTVGYRLAQFWWAIATKDLSATDGFIIESALTDEEWALFQRYTPSDQRHAVQVYQTLQDAGCNQPELLKAAILHDIGKTRIPLSVWDRTLVVIGEVLFPRKTSEWGSGEGVGWKRPFVVRSKHAEWGAQMAQYAGCGELVVRLIERHQDPPQENPQNLEDDMLGLLQWADNQN